MKFDLGILISPSIYFIDFHYLLTIRLQCQLIVKADESKSTKNQSVTYAAAGWKLLNQKLKNIIVTPTKSIEFICSKLSNKSNEYVHNDGKTNNNKKDIKNMENPRIKYYFTLLLMYLYCI